MKLDWTTGGSLAYGLKLAVWLLFSLGQVGFASLQGAADKLPDAGAVRLAILAVLGLVSVWLIARLIRLLLLGGAVATAGVLALHFLQR